MVDSFLSQGNQGIRHGCGSEKTLRRTGSAGKARFPKKRLRDGEGCPKEQSMPEPIRQSRFLLFSASVFLTLVALSTTPVCADVPQFQGLPSDEEFARRKADNDGIATLVSTDGTVKLVWGSQDEVLGTESEDALPVFELQQASALDFATAETRFQGTDVESYVSGLSEGAHFFRVRSGGGEWSAPIEVRVTFIDRGKLFLLLGIGFVVAAATAGAIISGYFKHRHDS